MTERKSRTSWLSERYWRKNKLAHSFALLSVIGLAATGIFAVEDGTKLSGSGLSGIFPATPPADLSEGEFAKLDGNWAEWSKSASAAVTDFYSKIDSTDASAQRQALGNLKIKLDVMRRALDDSRYASLHNPLTALHNSLAMRIDLAEATLDTLEFHDVKQTGSKIKARATELQSSIDGLERYVSSIGNGALWLSYFKVEDVKTALAADTQGPAALAAAKASQTNLLGRSYQLDGSQKEFASRPAFEAYANAINLYVSSAAWANADEAMKSLRNEFKSLATAVDAYATTGEKASDLRHAFARVRFVSADGGERVASSLQNRLFNYNLRLLVTEDFLNRLMSQNRQETGPVSDCILGATVSGCQITNTTVNVDLKPSNNTARFDLRLNGHIQSNTQGVTPQATVWTFGNHVFTASKEINFDGDRFSTLPATISVSPNNTTTGVATKFSGIPILGGIANKIAAGEVEKRRGEAESIAASRVQDGVLPRFNSEVDASFASAGDQLNRELFSGLRNAGLFPDSYSYQSTDRLLTMNARLMSKDQIGAGVPESSLMTATGATALLHETVLNNAIDQMGIAGQTLTEAELRAKIEDFLTKALNRPFKFEAPPADQSALPADEKPGEEEKSLSAIIFAPTDPIRLRVVDGELQIVIRAGFKREGQDDIPTREITVPISFDVEGTKINARRGNVIVAAAEGQGGGIQINAVVRKKIQSVLPDRAVDSKIELKAPDKTVVAYVTKIRLVDGWVAISID